MKLTILVIQKRVVKRIAIKYLVLRHHSNICSRLGKHSFRQSHKLQLLKT